MKLAEKVYQTSGVMFGTNSNTYCIDTREGLVLIDAGFSEKQYQIQREQRKADGLTNKQAKDLFITHSHFDHAGGGWMLQKEGFWVYMGRADAEAVSRGDERVLGALFERGFHCFRPDGVVKEGQEFDYGNAHLTILEHPGHTEGTISVLAEAAGKKILFTGDLFVLQPCTPLDKLQAEIGWKGAPDYNEAKNLDTFRRLRELPPVDLIAPGHGSVYFGDSRELFELLCHMAERNES